MAEKIMTGQVKLANRTRQAIAYHSVDVTPFWSASMHKTTQIGNHIFYRFAPRNAAPAPAHTAPPETSAREYPRHQHQRRRASESPLPETLVGSESPLRRA